MKVLMLLALLAFVAVVAGGCWYLVRRIRAEQSQSEAFLSMLTVAVPDKEPREDYDRERERVFKEFRSEFGWDEDRLEEDKEGDPANTWLRELSEAPRNALRAALMKRAVAVFPIIAALPQELQQKAQMYQRGLVGQPQWKSVLALRDWFEDETIQIRHEAECLAEKWGFEGGIFRDAAALHKHLAKKRMDAGAAQMQELRQRRAN